MPADEAIILAGGRGTRLRGVVSEVPKPLAPVAGRPFLAWVLDHLAANGIRRCILATGHLSKMIEDCIGDHWQHMQVAYSVEESALGTGGAVAQASQHVQGDAAHVLNGDTFLRYSPAALEAATQRMGTSIGIALAHVEEVARYGAVLVDNGRVQAFQEKDGNGPGLINAGSYFFSRAALDQLDLQAPFSLESDVLLPQAASGGIAAFSETADFIDIGVPEDYARAQLLFADRA